MNQHNPSLWRFPLQFWHQRASPLPMSLLPRLFLSCLLRAASLTFYSISCPLQSLLFIGSVLPVAYHVLLSTSSPPASGSHWFFFFFFSISQFKVWGKNLALLIFLSKLCLKSLALGQELIQRPGRPTNRGCWRWPQVCQAQSLLPSPRRAYTTIILYSCSWAAASHFRLWIKELYMSSMPRWNTG